MKRKLALAAALLMLPLAFMVTQAQTTPTITGGPTVTAITETTATISWQTNIESSSIVQYGLTRNLGLQQRNIVLIDLGQEEDQMSFSHSVTLLELESGTEYFFRAKSDADPSIQNDEPSTASAIGSFTTESPVPSCTADEWNCTEWGACSSGGAQARTCTLKTDCSAVETPKPGETQQCTPSCTADIWTCTSWGACSSGGAQARVCTLTTDCPTAITPEPAESQSCTPPPAPEPEPASEPAPEPEPASEPAPEPEPASEEEPQPVLSASLQTSVADLEQSMATSGVTDGVIMSVTAVAEAPDLCAERGIAPERCPLWLEARFKNTTCADAGITTRETCEKYLTDLNGGVFPGCEGVTGGDCARAKDLALIGYMSVEVRARADLVIDQLLREKTAVNLPGLMPVKEEKIANVGWWNSAASPGTETAPGVVVLDMDGDTLPDDFEKQKGTDPTKPDTDGDGVNDNEEMKKGTNPAGPGRMAGKLDPTEQTVVFRKPLEQPRGAGKVEGSFAIDIVQRDEAAPDTKTNTLMGRCAPNATCLLYVYSYIPMVLTTAADANGNFTYDLGDSVIDGTHTVYVAVTDDTGKIEKKSTPLSFFVREAQAVSREDFLRSDIDVTPEPAAAEFQRYYLLGAAALVLVAVILAWHLTARMRTSKA